MDKFDIFQNIGRIIRLAKADSLLSQTVIDRTIRRKVKYKARLREKQINRILK